MIVTVYGEGIRVEEDTRHGVIVAEVLRLAQIFEPRAEQSRLLLAVVELKPERPAHSEVLVQAFAQRRRCGTNSHSDEKSDFRGGHRGHSVEMPQKLLRLDEGTTRNQDVHRGTAEYPAPR